MSHPSTTWTLTPTEAAAAATSSSTGSRFTPGVDLALDADGDLEIGADARFTESLEAVAQGLSIRLQSIRGEWFPDLDNGVPYFERDGVDESEAILGQKFDEAKTRAIFRDEIASAPGVVTIDELLVEFDNATREMTLSFTVTTTFGVIEVSELEI